MPSKDDPKSPYPETRTTIWIKSLGMFLIGVATVLTSFTAVRVQKSIAENQHVNGERDIQLRQDNARFQEATEANRLAASVLQFLRCQEDLQRVAALRLLAPDQARLFAGLINAKCTSLTPQAKSEISGIEEESELRERRNAFQTLLLNAKEFKDRGFDGPASRIFNDASNQIPEHVRSKVDITTLSRAKSAFANGKFAEAADLFVIAFAAIAEIG